MEKCAVVIPIYRDVLAPVEKFSLDNNINKLRGFPIYFVIPKTLSTAFLHAYGNLKIIRFDDKFFQGYKGYNRLMLSEEFYRTFKEYEKILICQLDAYVFTDRLEYFCNLPYDYIGAPAFLDIHGDGSYEIQPGNGGFSLRDVKKTMNLLKAHTVEKDEWKDTEDRLFSFCALKYPEEFSMAPLCVAVSFAFDRFVSIMYEWNHRQLPFGIHAWYTHDPRFVCCFMMNESKCLPDDIKNSKSKKEIMTVFYEFLSRNSSIVLYGAGDWGKVIGCALQILRVNIRCFAISDGHQKPGQEICGIPLCYWSEIAALPKGTGVILSMSQRYLIAKEREELHQIIRARNVDDILDVDNQLFSFIAEIILERGEKK